VLVFATPMQNRVSNSQSRKLEGSSAQSLKLFDSFFCSKGANLLHTVDNNPVNWNAWLCSFLWQPCKRQTAKSQSIFPCTDWNWNAPVSRLTGINVMGTMFFADSTSLGTLMWTWTWKPNVENVGGLMNIFPNTHTGSQPNTHTSSAFQGVDKDRGIVKAVQYVVPVKHQQATANTTYHHQQ